MSRHGATLARGAPVRPAEPGPAAGPEPMPASPWSARTGRLLAIVVVVAAVVLGIAWYGCSGETIWHVQVRWFGLGVLACAVNAVACLVWLASGLREVRRARAWTAVALRGRGLLPVPVRAAAGAVPAGDLVTSARMRRYHRTDCPLMAGKAAEAVTAESATARGLDACGICEA
jgi:hypothetical protein